MIGEEVEYQGRLIHLVQNFDGRWSFTIWRHARSLDQISDGPQFAASRDAALERARRLVDQRAMSKPVRSWSEAPVPQAG